MGIGVLGFLGFGDWVLASLLKSVNFGQFCQKVQFWSIFGHFGHPKKVNFGPQIDCQKVTFYQKSAKRRFWGFIDFGVFGQKNRGPNLLQICQSVDHSSMSNQKRREGFF